MPSDLLKNIKHTGTGVPASRAFQVKKNDVDVPLIYYIKLCTDATTSNVTANARWVATSSNQSTSPWQGHPHRPSNTIK